MTLKPASLDIWIWVLVYVGLLALSLGLFLRTGAIALGWSAIVAGALATAAGVLLVWVRSRIAA